MNTYYFNSYIKTGAIIVTSSLQINKSFLNYTMNSFDKKILPLFQTKYNFRKTVDEMTYIN